MPSENQSRNQKIVKNTFLLYTRMILMMFVSLFTVRIVLKNLGIEDYGIYNLIGGVVVMFNFITNTSSAATQRYLNYALGENNSEKASDVFSASFIIHGFAALLLLVSIEIFGIWSINHYLTIPADRIIAANYTLQFSIIVLILNIFRIPYNAAIIAYERMSIYTFFSIFDCAGKLIIALLISIFDYDKLILYSLLVLLINFINFIILIMYVKRCFNICKIKKIVNKEIYKELLTFSGWSLLSSIGSTCSNQGLTFILNKFYGVVANAAMGIANQVNSTVYQLISNFQIAFEPQITKSYAANDRDYLLDLIFKTSKFSLFLLWFFVLPLGLNAQIVLQVWLSEVPESSVLFLRLILIYSLIQAFVGPLWMVAYAIGNIRNYQIVAIIVDVATLPVLFLLFKLGFPSYWIIIIRIISTITFAIYRLFYLKSRMNFPLFDFTKNVIVKSILVILFSLILSYGSFIITQTNIILQFFFSCSITVIANIFFMYFIGCNKQERQKCISLLKKFLIRKRNTEK